MTAEKKTSSKAKIKSVTLKRTVTIKAIVTEKFKEYMKFELNTAMNASENRIRDIDLKLKDLTNSPEAELLKQQLSMEKIQLNNSLTELRSKLEQSAKLQIDTKFVQGTIDGFVTVSEGDNIYEKLGGMEIVAKDGVVEEIIPVAEIKP